MWPNSVDKLSPPTTCHRAAVHTSPWAAGGVDGVQTGSDLLEIVRQERGQPRARRWVSSAGRQLSPWAASWMLSLAKKMEVRAIFTGYYGKGKAVPIRSGRKGGSFQSCTII